MTFTSTLVTIFKILNFTNISLLFQKHGTILGKFVCDLITSLILSFVFGLSYFDNNKSSKTFFSVFIAFGIIPCSLYTIVGCLLECYAQNIEDIGDPLAQL